MWKILFYFGLVIPSVLCTQGDDLLKIASEVRIFETPENFQSPLGVVYGARSCGGPAEVIDWRYEGCTGEGICKVPTDGKNRVGHFTFVPSEQIPGGVYIRGNLSGVGIPNRTYDIPVPDSRVRGGRLYTIEAASSPAKKYQGKTITFQYNVMRQEDNFVEACAEAEYEFV